MKGLDIVHQQIYGRGKDTLKLKDSILCFEDIASESKVS